MFVSDEAALVKLLQSYNGSSNTLVSTLHHNLRRLTYQVVESHRNRGSVSSVNHRTTILDSYNYSLERSVADKPAFVTCCCSFMAEGARLAERVHP